MKNLNKKMLNAQKVSVNKTKRVHALKQFAIFFYLNVVIWFSHIYAHEVSSLAGFHAAPKYAVKDSLLLKTSL